MAEILLFADRNFGGLHTHLFEDAEDFRQLSFIGQGVVTGGTANIQFGNWNDNVSSFVIVSGEWRFFKDINFQNQYGTGNNSATPGNFGVGIYAWVEDWGIDNDSLSSIQVAVI